MRKILTILFIIFVLSCRAQLAHLFTSDYDISSSLINKVLYDSRGNLWIATADGLNRFDGCKFTIYRHSENDSTSLSSNYIPNIFEDSKGRLMLITYQGVQIYDPVTDSFSPIPKDTKSLPLHQSISQIIEDEEGHLILAGSYLAEARINDGNKIRLSSVLHANSIGDLQSMILDKDGTIWFYQDQKGVGAITKNGKMTRYLASPDDPQIESWVIGKDGTLYAGTVSRGLWRYNKQKDTFELVAPKTDFMSSIKCLYTEEDGTILIGTDGHGIKVYDPSTNKITAYTDYAPGAGRFKVHSITRDEYGNLWLGLYQKGLMLVPNQDKPFSNIGAHSFQPTLIGDACITAVLRDKNDNLWIGTDNDGFYKLNPELNQSQHFLGSNYPVTVNQFYHDSQDRIWILSYDKSIGQLLPNGQFRPLRMVNNGHEVKSAFDIYESKDGTLWIGSMGNGLFSLAPDATEPVHFEYEGYYNPWINCVVIENDIIYIGTYDGIFAISDNDVKHLLKSTIITSMEVESDGNIWAGSFEGLININPKGDVKVYREEDGLPNSMVHAVEGMNDEIWISTNSGLSRYIKAEDNFVNYSVKDGLQGNEFYNNVSCQDKNGYLFFGGLNGVTYFKPTEVLTEPVLSEIRINNFYVGDEAVRGGMLSNGRLITDRSVPETEKFCLGPGENFCSIDFCLHSDLGLGAPTYYYALDGNNWQALPQQLSTIAGGNRLTFSKLTPGSHTLKLKAKVSGHESAVKSIVIDIAPMWYQTWWSWTIFGLIILFILGYVWLQYRNRQRRKLETQQHKHEAEIKEAKLQFFTNVSHEIKTPMTLVMSPIEQLMSQDTDPERQRIYRMVMRNSKRIMRLVNEIMDLRKIDNHQMQMKYTCVCLADFLHDLYITFQPAAEKKNIDFSFTHNGCDHLEADIDMTNFDKVVMNLLSNAIKYTPEGGKVNMNLSVAYEEDKEYVVLAVTDTGIGVPESERNHIFERFYRVANNQASGTGIGLHLAYRLMQLLQGSLYVENNPDGEGSKFIVKFPVKACTDQVVPKYNEQSITTPVREIPENLSNPDDDNQENTSRRRSDGLVYVVEDDAEINKYIANSLSGNYKVMTFENGVQALEAIFKQAPDLVISDIMMPEMDGFTLIKRLRTNVNLNHIPVILLTAKTSEQDILAGLEQGADAYVPKPFNMNILMSKVQNLIQSNQRLKNVYSGRQKQHDKVEGPKVLSHDEELLEKVMRVINSDLSNSELTIEMIANKIGISRVHLHRRLKEITNQTTRDFIRNIRLQKAAEIMCEKRINVSEVSDLVGFKNPNNFSTAFKELFGQTPTEYMNQKQS